MKQLIKILVASGAALGMMSHAAELFVYTEGNMILGFQATGGTGADKNILFDLGSGVGLRDNPNQGTLGNLGTTLSAVYGADWHTRSDLYFGVTGNLNRQPNTGVGSRPAVDGDPSRTFYISTAASTPRAGVLSPAGTYVSSALGAAGSAFRGMKDLLLGVDNGWRADDPDPLARGLYMEADGAGVLDQSLPQHAIAWQNGWTQWNPTPGAAFDVFTGGIQQSFAGNAPHKYVDIQRILSTNTGAVPTGVVGGGTYISSIAIGSDGTVRAVTSSVSGGSTPLEDWVATFPALVSSANAVDRTPAGDFDKDGIPNTREFAFGGSPVSATDNGKEQLRSVDANADTLRDFTQTVEVRSGGIFSPSGNKLTAAVDGIIYTIEGSLDLVTFNSVVSEVTPTLGTGTPKAGYVFKTFRLNAANGLNGKGFIRVGAAASAN